MTQQVVPNLLLTSRQKLLWPGQASTGQAKTELLFWKSSGGFELPAVSTCILKCNHCFDVNIKLLCHPVHWKLWHQRSWRTFLYFFYVFVPGILLALRVKTFGNLFLTSALHQDKNTLFRVSSIGASERHHFEHVLCCFSRAFEWPILEGNP